MRWLFACPMYAPMHTCCCCASLGPGDLVVLDAGRAELLDGEVFVVRTGEGLVVKRLRRRDDRWELESDNPAYEPRALAGQDQILGSGGVDRATVRWTQDPVCERRSEYVVEAGAPG